MAVRWIDKGRPGYSGAKRDAIQAGWNNEFGAGNWKLVWAYGSLRCDFLDACNIYEQAYHLFLLRHPATLDLLVREASEIYDTELSNIRSGFDYAAQEGNRTHIQDIAIRRVLRTEGLAFKGPEPIRIRQEQGPHPLSMTLSPGRVPFHRPELIIQPQLEGWWHPDTVEAFWQSNKILAVKETASG